jgi:protein-disulfide isomerase
MKGHMQRSIITRTALIIVLTGGVLTGAVFMLAQTASKKTGSKSSPPNAASASKGLTSSALPSKTVLTSFLKHMFNYKPQLTYEVKEVKLLPGTQIADASVDFKDAKDPNGSGEKHLYVLADRKHAIAGGNAMPFDAAEPKMTGGLPTNSAVIDFVRRHFLQGSTAPIQADVRKSDLPGITEANVAVNNGQSGGKLFITTDGQWVLTGEVIPFGADPFAGTRTALAKGNGVTKGPASSPVTVVEFSDLECPACKAAQPVVDQLLAQQPDVRFIFQNYPLDQIHPWAFRAAQYADCVGRENNAAFWKFVENVYADQPNINTQNVNDKLLNIAGSAGVDKGKLQACVEDANTKARIWASQQLGKEVEVTGTPTVFINGRKVASVAGTGVDGMKMLIEGAKKDK